MTLKEKVTDINPGCIDDSHPGGVDGCPSRYRYLPEGMDYCKKRGFVFHDFTSSCIYCWNQEIPEEEKKDDYTYSESASIIKHKEYESSDKKHHIYYAAETVASVLDDLKKDYEHSCSLYETRIAILDKRIKILKDENETLNAAVREEFTASDYHEAALRTASDKCRSLANCAMGLAGEAGECADIIKKHLFHDHDLDKEHLAKELGDVAWYIAVCAEVIGYNLEDILKMNIEKLKARYPDGFDSEKSKNRAEDDV